MDEKKKMLDDESLDQVVGCARRYISSSDNGYVNIRSGPGSGYSVEYSLNNGQLVNTTGYKVYNERDGYSWSELDNGCWVPTHLLG